MMVDVEKSNAAVDGDTGKSESDSYQHHIVDKESVEKIRNIIGS